MHLLLLHGALGASDQLRKLAAELEQDYTVHLLDFSGHGAQPFPDQPWSIPLFADEVLAYMDKNKLPQVSIFGYSMGGYVGLYLARHRGERIHQLAALATKFHWDPETALKETQKMNPKKVLEKVPTFAQALEQRHQQKDWKEVLKRTADLMTSLGENPPLTPEDYTATTTPTLVLLGDRDRMVSLEETVAAYQGLPNAQFAVLPATSHPIEQVDAKLLAYHLRRFFNGKA
ncbi:MAG: alpha/beta fold hydrolase [Bacteroidetes bacterium]|nr:alpha/beta fold hydrolase [Bacteroidota bacterium]